jgi:NADH:ubiquinone oxidoreductase subunit 3 (subunit A)
MRNIYTIEEIEEKKMELRKKINRVNNKFLMMKMLLIIMDIAIIVILYNLVFVK